MLHFFTLCTANFSEIQLNYAKSYFEIVSETTDTLKAILKFEDGSFSECNKTLCLIEDFRPSSSNYIIYLMEESKGRIETSYQTIFRGKYLNLNVHLFSYY